MIKTNRQLMSNIILILVSFMFGIGAYLLHGLSCPYKKNADGVHIAYASVEFIDQYHDLHMENMDCLECHHIYENGKNILSVDALENGESEIYCNSCHYSGNDMETGKSMDTEEVFHDLCIGCHERVREDSGAQLPVLCGECHIKHSTEK